MALTRDISSVEGAIHHLEKALSVLEAAIDAKLENVSEVSDYEEEVQRMNTDRSRLAQALDESEARAERLETANHDVSRRLITAMETIRSVVE